MTDKEFWKGINRKPSERLSLYAGIGAGFVGAVLMLAWFIWYAS